MEVSNVVLVLLVFFLLMFFFILFFFGEGMGIELMFLLFDDIWMKLMEFVKKLCDIMCSYNVEK